MKKAAIQPITAYVNGKQMTATHINVQSVSDNLFDRVQFKYTFFDENGSWAGEAMYELNGVEAYSQWDASPEGAYQIVGDGIGIVFVPPTIGKSAFFEG